MKHNRNMSFNVGISAFVACLIKGGCWLDVALLGCLILAPSAQAASFDCVKATTKVENLICASAELSKLDDDLNAAYKNALQDEKQADAIRQAQKQWMKERNHCSDARCVKQTYESKIQNLSSHIHEHTPSDAGMAAQQAGQQPIKSEAEKAQRVKAILEKYPLNFSAEDSAGLMFHPDLPEAERNRLKNSPQYQAQTAEFCTGFYGAMQRADKAIQYIEPIVRTDDPNHPGLAQYHSCADAEDRPNWQGVGEGIYEHIDMIGDRAFKLYRLDLDGNPKNGLEEYLYAELDVKQTLAQSPGYNRIDFKRCEFMDGVSVDQDQELHSGWHRNNYNAMIRYRGGYYVFDLHNILWSSSASNELPFYHLNLYRYSSKQHAFVGAAVCIFRRQPESN